jgi:hypothetical protein
VSPTPGATVSSSVPTSTAQSGGSNKAEIIGSVVGSVGGIAGILLAVASLWFAWRQWKIMKAAKEDESSMDTSHQQSDPGDGTPQSGTQALTSKPTEILPASSLASPEAVKILQT